MNFLHLFVHHSCKRNSNQWQLAGLTGPNSEYDERFCHNIADMTMHKSVLRSAQIKMQKKTSTPKTEWLQCDCHEWVSCTLNTWQEIVEQLWCHKSAPEHCMNLMNSLWHGGDLCVTRCCVLSYQSYHDVMHTSLVETFMKQDVAIPPPSSSKPELSQVTGCRQFHIMSVQFNSMQVSNHNSLLGMTSQWASGYWRIYLNILDHSPKESWVIFKQKINSGDWSLLIWHYRIHNKWTKLIICNQNRLQSAKQMPAHEYFKYFWFSFSSIHSLQRQQETLASYSSKGNSQ